MLNKYSDILTINELCEIMKCGKNYVYKLVSSGKIQACRTQKNGKYLIPKENLIRYLNNT